MNTTNVNDVLVELSLAEIDQVAGAGNLPPIPAVKFEIPTWKYVSGTPRWAVEAAIAAGYEVEKID